jgi:hypothetical protein
VFPGSDDPKFPQFVEAALQRAQLEVVVMEALDCVDDRGLERSTTIAVAIGMVKVQGHVLQLHGDVSGVTTVGDRAADAGDPFRVIRFKVRKKVLLLFPTIIVVLQDLSFEPAACREMASASATPVRRPPVKLALLVGGLPSIVFTLTCSSCASCSRVSTRAGATTGRAASWSIGSAGTGGASTAGQSAGLSRGGGSG